MSNTKKKQLERVTIVLWGTRGDIQPCIAIGAALKAKGVHVRVLTHTGATHVGLVESVGLTPVPFYGDLEHKLTSDPNFKKTMVTGSPYYLGEALKTRFNEDTAGACREFLEEAKNHPPDLFIFSQTTDLYSYYATFQLKIPCVVCYIYYASLNDPNRVAWGGVPLPCGMHIPLVKAVLLPEIYKTILKFDKIMAEQSGGEPFMKEVLPKGEFIQLHGDQSRLPLPGINFLVQSSLFRDILYPGVGIPDNLPSVGAAIMPEAAQAHEQFGGTETKQAIEAFLKQDPDRKPVYLGWGSLTSRSSAYMVQFAVHALLLSGQRGIVLGGLAKLGLEGLLEKCENGYSAARRQELHDYAKANVHFAAFAPHEWLFPRMAATVSHAGSGTLAASTRAGVPTIVTPIFMDQWDNSYIVNELGCGYGFSKHLQKISPKELAKAIEKVIGDPDINAKAKEVGEYMQKEDGTGRIVNDTFQFWNDVVQTGKWEELVQARYDEAKAFNAAHKKKWWSCGR